MKKIIPSICMLLVTAVLMGTSTYAWFSMNRKVEVKGMQVSAVTSSNLVISNTNVGEVTNVNDFKISYTTKTALTPASSANGKAFFSAQGEAKGPDKSELEENKYNSVNAATAEGKNYYVKETFYIGINGVEDLKNKIDVTVNMTSKDAAGEDKTGTNADIYKALRFAVYYDENNAIIFSGNAEAASGQAVSSVEETTGAGTKSTVTFAKTGTNSIPSLTELTHNQWYKITVVIWLEGEDAACTANNTNGANTQGFAGVSVDFTFTVGDSTVGG